jgi:ferric-dicitrate binding protein FerR (iron transport regulator)
MSNVDDEEILRGNLRVPTLSPEALARIRRATEAEWRVQTGGSPRRLWIPRAAAAAVAVLALAAAWQLWVRSPGVAEGEPMAQLARAEGAGVVELRSLWRDTTIGVGGELRSGRDFEARGGSLLKLHGGGNVRVAPNSRFEVLSANSVRLDRGEMYVDIPPGAHADASFVAVTGAGEFRHLGTQFAIAVVNGTTRLRVREGQVQWRAPDGDSTLPAGTEVLIDRHMNVTRGAVESVGQHWSWTETMAPEIDIDNRPLGEFLAWFARETGRKLVYADDGTQQQIDSIRMHGSVRGLTPMQALKAVMSSTSLRFDLPAGAIRVSFAGESPTST